MPKKKTAHPLRVLIIEDSPDDAELLLLRLKKDGFAADWRRVETEAGFLEGLDWNPDLILADYSLPQFSGLRALRLLKQRALDIPFVLISGTIGEEIAVEAMKEGAYDYLLKASLARLGSAVHNAMQEKQLRDEKRIAEEALRESEERFRSLYENATLGIYRTTPDGQILLANPALVSMLGYQSFEELAQRNLEQEGFEPDYPRQRFKEQLERDGEVRGLESVWTRRDGPTIFVRESARVVRDSTGKILYYEGTVEDITEWKRAEDALRQSEAMYRGLFENVPDGVYRSTPNGRILAANPALVRMLGYESEEELKHVNTARDLYVDPSGRRKHRRALEQSGAVHSAELVLKRKDGGQIVVLDNSRAVYDRQGNVLYYEGTLTDITERKRAEQALREGEDKFSKAFHAGPDSVLIIRLSDQIALDVNEGFISATGHTREEVVGKKVSEFSTWVDPEDERLFNQILQERGRVIGMETALRGKDGRIVQAAISASLIEIGGEPCAIFISRDITKRKRAEKALRASEAELRALFAAMPDVIFVLDKEGRYLKVAPTRADLLYKPADELVGRRLHDIFSRPKADEFVGYIRSALETRQPLQFEYALLIGDRIVWFSGVTSRITDDIVIWVGRDITERKQAEEQINRRVTELEALYYSGLVLGQTLDPKEIGERIIQVLAERLDWHHAAVRIHREGTDEVELLAFNRGHQHMGGRSRAQAAITRVGQGMVGWVIEHGRALRSDDLESDDRYFETFPGMRSGLYVPMKVGERTIGCISVESDQPEAFDGNDERLLTTVAGQAAVAFENARLFTQIQSRAEEFETLYAMTRDIATHQDPNRALQAIVERAAQLLRAPVGGIYLYDPTRNDLELAVNVGLTLSLGVRLAIGEGAAGRVAQTRQPIIVDDYQTWEGRSPKYEDAPLRAVLQVPMIYSGELIGVLAVDEIGDSERKFTEADMRLLSLFAAHAASAVHTARLFAKTVSYAKQLETINSLGRTLAETLDLQRIYERLSRAAVDLLPNTSTVFISLFNPQEKMISAAYGLQDGEEVDVSSLPALPLSPPGKGTQSQAIHTAEPVIIGDLPASYQKRKVTPVKVGTPGPETQSALYVPMIAEGKVIGVLQVQSYIKNRYSEADAKLLSLVSNNAAVAIQNARLFGQLDQRIGQLSALHAIDMAIGATTDMRVSLQVVLENALRQLRVDAADILLLNPMTLSLDYAAGVGFRLTEFAGSSLLRLGEGLAGHAALTKEKIYLPDSLAAHPKFISHPSLGLEQFSGYVCMPLIAKGEVKGVLELFQRTPLHIDEGWTGFLDVLAGQAAIAVDNATLFKNLESVNADLVMAYDATIEGWSQALELRDQETQGHSRRVLDLTIRLARAIGIPDAEMLHIRRGVLLHDIGKMGIPDEILHKPDELTEEEWVIMRRHPHYAHEMLAPITYLRQALDIPYCHHEKWDGSGYPRGLKGEQIPLAARIFAVVDVYDALSSNRPYRPAWPKEKVLDYLREQSGKHFDPQVVDAFFKLPSDK